MRSVRVCAKLGLHNCHGIRKHCLSSSWPFRFPPLIIRSNFAWGERKRTDRPNGKTREGNYRNATANVRWSQQALLCLFLVDGNRKPHYMLDVTVYAAFFLLILFLLELCGDKQQPNASFHRMSDVGEEQRKCLHARVHTLHHKRTYFTQGWPPSSGRTDSTWSTFRLMTVSL